VHPISKFAAAGAALTAAIAFAEPALAVTYSGSSAYGVAASGLVPLSPTPAVTAPAGQPKSVQKSLVSLPANGVLSAKVLGVNAGPGKARASVADLRVAKAKLAANAVTATCLNGVGKSQLVHATICDRTLESAPKPNTTIPVRLEGLGTVTVTLNKQERRHDGRLTVTALSVRVPLGKVVQTVDVSSATCAAAGSQPSPGPGDNGPGDDSGSDDGTAPVPTPVKGDLPVTG
jgi:hypothetical protein